VRRLTKQALVANGIQPPMGGRGEKKATAMVIPAAVPGQSIADRARALIDAGLTDEQGESVLLAEFGGDRRRGTMTHYRREALAKPKYRRTKFPAKAPAKRKAAP
jgi:hypothetical protein